MKLWIGRDNLAYVVSKTKMKKDPENKDSVCFMSDVLLKEIDDDVAMMLLKKPLEVGEQVVAVISTQGSTREGKR